MTRLGLLSIIAAAIAASVAPDSSYAANAFDDFSTAGNPNGNWSYGQMASISSSFSALTTQWGLVGNSMQGWGTSGSLFPFVLKNQTSTEVVDGDTHYQAGLLALHPSSSGILSAVRWISPTSGQYSITATFNDVPNAFPATSDVHILVNGSSIFNNELSANTLSQSFSGLQQLNAGDAVTFSVGFGSNSNYYNDHTGLSATITAVPEPETYTMLLAGLGLMGAIARSRKNKRA